jgi:hypothetical protein
MVQEDGTSRASEKRSGSIEINNPKTFPLTNAISNHYLQSSPDRQFFFTPGIKPNSILGVEKKQQIDNFKA